MRNATIHCHFNLLRLVHGQFTIFTLDTFEHLGPIISSPNCPFVLYKCERRAALEGEALMLRSEEPLSPPHLVSGINNLC